MINFTNSINDYLQLVKKTIDAIPIDDLNTFMNVLLEARDSGKSIFVMGNGGSAATASHYVCDFNKGLSYNRPKRFKFHCLNDNVPTMMAYANDIGYDVVFVEALANFFQKGDLVIGISGSGNSPNVLKAIDYANDNGGTTIGISGYSGGKLKQKCKYNIHIAVDNMQVAEDIHMLLDHLIVHVLNMHNV